MKKPSSSSKVNWYADLDFYKNGLWVQALRQSHDQLIDDLYAQASKGSRAHFFSLLRIANKAVTQIRELTQTHFDTACDLAQRLELWPTALRPHQPFVLDGKDLVKRLNLGAAVRVPFKIDETYQSANTPRHIAALVINATSQLVLYGETLPTPSHYEKLLTLAEESGVEEYLSLTCGIKNQLAEAHRERDAELAEAINLLNQVRSVLELHGTPAKTVITRLARKAAELPPLSASSMDIWFEFGRELISCLIDGKPEKNPVLRKLGWYRRFADLQKKFPPGPEFERRKKMAEGSASSETNIRDGAFTAIRAAYKTVVKHLAVIERVTSSEVSPWIYSEKNGER